MVQTARSDKQNIAKASMAAGASKETEIRLTNVARSSLEELLIDYQMTQGIYWSLCPYQISPTSRNIYCNILQQALLH